MVVHLDFFDIGPLPRHEMDDRVGQSDVVGPYGGNDGFHRALCVNWSIETLSDTLIYQI